MKTLTTILTAIFVIIFTVLPCYANPIVSPPGNYKILDGSNDILMQVERLRSADPRVQADAVIVLGNMGIKAVKAVPELIKCLGSKNGIRSYYAEEAYHTYDIAILAIWALGEIGDRRAVQPIINKMGGAFGSSNDDAAYAGALALKNITGVFVSEAGPDRWQKWWNENKDKKMKSEKEKEKENLPNM